MNKGRDGLELDRITRLFDLLNGVIAGFYDREGPSLPSAENPGQRGVHSIEVVITSVALAVETVGKLPPAVRALMVNELMGALESGLRTKGFTVHLPRVDDIPNPSGPIQ
jgi:hypothetical protein